MSRVFVFAETCKGMEDCGLCAVVCPKDLFEKSGALNQAGYLPPSIRDEAECTGCENCMLSCPDFAIVVEKQAAEEEDRSGGEDD